MTTRKTTRRAKTARAFDATEGPGLRRLRSAKNADAIREAVTTDQRVAQRAARARIEAASAAPQAAADGPSPTPAPEAPAHVETAPAPAGAPPSKGKPPGKVIEPTPIPVTAEKMEGMNAKTVALYLAAARGELPEPPDLSQPSTSPSDRRELETLTAMAEAGDIAGLRAYAIRVYYSGAAKLDRYRQCAVIALEARRAKAA